MPEHKNAARQMAGVVSDEQPTKQSIEFAATLRAWRLAIGITQDQLAEMAGVSKSSISMAERAFHTYPPKEITQMKLAKALGISMAELRTMPSGIEMPIRLPEIITQKPPAPPKGVLQVLPSAYNEREMSNLQLPSKWILGATDIPEELSFIVANDTSMCPTINLGDIAIIEPCNTLVSGLLLVGQRNGGSVSQIGIRRVMPIALNKARVSCDNERFEGTTVQTEEQMAVLGKVLFVVRPANVE